MNAQFKCFYSPTVDILVACRYKSPVGIHHLCYNDDEIH